MQQSPPVSSGVYLRLILTMIFWGGTFVAGRMAAEELHPYTASAYRFVTASLILVLFLVLREGRLPSLTPRQWGGMFLLGATGIFAYNILFFMGLKSVEAGRGAMIIAANPVITAVLAVIVFGERFSLIRSGGIVVSVLGTLTVISRGEFGQLFTGGIGSGELCMIGCVLSWSAYALLGKRQLTKITPLVAVTCACLTGSAMLVVLTLLSPEARALSALSLKGSLSILYLAVFGTALGFIWFYEGVQKLGAGQASLFVNLVPVSGVAFGILFLDERLDLSLLVGGILVLVGLAIINRPVKDRRLD